MCPRTPDAVQQGPAGAGVRVGGLEVAELHGLLVLRHLQAVPGLPEHWRVVVLVRHLHPHHRLGKASGKPPVPGVDWQGTRAMF